MTQTPLEIFNGNKVLSVKEFCKLLLIDPTDKALDDELMYIESAYDSKGRRVISLHHLLTMKWMAACVENYSFNQVPPESKKFNAFLELLEALRIRIEKIDSLERKVFSENTACRSLNYD